MLTTLEAHGLVQKELSKLALGDDYVIIDSATKEYTWGWVFFYNTRSYIETDDVAHALIGNAPYIVNKETGELVITGTAYDIDVYVDEYLNTLTKS